MLFRYWNYTTCIEVEDFNTLEQEVTQLLEKEKGCHRLSQLPELDCTLNQLLNHPWEKLPNLWIIGLFKGSDQWTAIKTYPTGLLCRRADGTNQSRLSNLTKQIKCNAFHLEVHEDIGGFLFEADSRGNTFLSGCPGAEAPENFQFYDEPQVNEPDLIQQFSLINVSESIQRAIKINQSLEVKKQEAKLDELDSDAPQYFDLFVENPGYTQRIDLALADLFDPNRNYWFLKNKLPYKVYSGLEKLESIGAKILYFHSPNCYQPFIQPKIDFSRLTQNVFENEEELPF